MIGKDKKDNGNVELQAAQAQHVFKLIIINSMEIIVISMEINVSLN